MNVYVEMTPEEYDAFRAFQKDKITVDNVAKEAMGVTDWIANSVIHAVELDPHGDAYRIKNQGNMDDAGYLPVEAMRVQKGDPNQMIITELAAQRAQFFKPNNGEVVSMAKIPIIFKDRWQLYQTTEGNVYAFDIDFLEMVDFDDCEPEVVMRATGGTGIWYLAAQAVYIAPGHFSAEDMERLEYIAKMDWERQRENDDPAVNLNLFDAMRAEDADTENDAAGNDTEDAEEDNQE